MPGKSSTSGTSVSFSAAIGTTGRPCWALSPAGCVVGHSDRWFCSEIVATALDGSLGPFARLLSPSDLHMLMMNMVKQNTRLFPAASAA